MPGIFGFIDKNIPHEHAQVQLGEMLRCMRHESFYRHGTLHLPEHGCHFGWISHSNSICDANPIVSAKGDVILIFSGEHFSPTDRATGGSLLAQYEQRGRGFLRDLNGWFAGVLIDCRDDTILLFNDRFGMQRIYCNEGRESFTFASEAKALLAIRPETRELDLPAAGQFVAFGSVFGDRTLFSNVFLLPGGSSWVFKGPSEISKSRYFAATEWETQSVLDDEALYGELKAAVSTAIPAYLEGGDSVAVSLTGGLDTRMIMAATPPAVERMPCYTYSGVYRECFDIGVAREVAHACGHPHHVLRLGDDFFENFADYASQTVWLTDGCLDLCGVHEVYFSRLARQIASVRVTGNYGSEVIRSVSTFKPTVLRRTLFDGGFLPYVDQALRSFNEVTADHPVSVAAFKEIPWHLHGRLAAAQSQLTVRSPFMDNNIVSLMYRASDHFRRTNNAVVRLISDLRPSLAAIETDMGFAPTRSSTLSSWRTFYRYLLFKAEWYYNAGMPDWLSRFDRNVLKVLAPLFVGSHKIEHYRVWFGDRLFNYVQSMLSDRVSATRPYLERRSYSDFITAHRSGVGNYMNEISRLITLELIQRSLIEGSYQRTLSVTPSDSERSTDTAWNGRRVDPVREAVGGLSITHDAL